MSRLVYPGKLARRTAALLLAGLCLLPLHAAASVPMRDIQSAADFRRWEIGLGLRGSWAHLREAGEEQSFELDESAVGMGVVLGAAWRVTPRVSLAFEIASSRHDTSLPGVRGHLAEFTLGFRYLLLPAGGIRPYLRGSYGGSGAIIAPEGGGDGLELNGMAGIFGAGLRLAPSRRLQLDLELSHAVVNYQDASVTLESVYTGTRIDKAGHAIRLQLVSYFLF